MRTNGFIVIVLVFAAVTLAGTPNYLPNVGPVGLHFAAPTKPAVVMVLPPLPAPPTMPSETPATQSTGQDNTAPPPGTETNPAALTPVLPVIEAQPAGAAVTNINIIGPMIGPLMDTNSAVTPQMFLRFFTPNQNGNSREAVIVAPAGFSPALPPAASSTATYSQPKP